MPIEFVATGRLRTVAFAECQSGELLAKQFLESLAIAEAQKFRALFQWMADSGEIHNERKFKLEEGKIWTFKHNCRSGQIRFPCFRIQSCWLLTHGFYKEGKKWRREHLRKAERIRTEHIGRYGETLP
jgi:hypothetical protein